MTPNNEPWLKRLDEYVFKKVDELKAMPFYRSIPDFVGGIDDDYRDYFKIGGTLVFFLIPGIVLLILLSNTLAIKEEWQIKKDIISTAVKIQSNRRRIENESQLIFANQAFRNTDEGAFTSKVTAALNLVGVDSGKFEIGQYESEEIGEQMHRAQARFKFNNLTIEELSSALTVLVSQERMKIAELEINRNDETKNISGVFMAVHFGKAAP